MKMNSDAAAALGITGDFVYGVSFAGEVFDAVLQVDSNEHQRRITAGLPAIADRDVLAAMAGLPYGLPVPWRDLTPWDETVVSAAPPGLVIDLGTSVVRVWRPAVRVRGVLIKSERNWKSAITAAAWFWCDARRVAVVSTFPIDPAKAAAVARRQGVGLAVARVNQVTVLAEPAATSPLPGARHWRFLETCYAAWLAQARIQAER